MRTIWLAAVVAIAAAGCGGGVKTQADMASGGQCRFGGDCNPDGGTGVLSCGPDPCNATVCIQLSPAQGAFCSRKCVTASDCASPWPCCASVLAAKWCVSDDGAGNCP